MVTTVIQLEREPSQGYLPSKYPFVGSTYGTGSTFSGAITTLASNVLNFSGGVTDYQLQTCAGTLVDGSSPAYTAVQVTISGFSSVGLACSAMGGSVTNATYCMPSHTNTATGAATKDQTGTTIGWVTGTSLSSFTTFYTGSCSAVTYIGLTLSGAYANYDCVSANTAYHNMTVATLRSRGESTLTSGGPTYKISASTGDGYKQGDVDIDCSETYSDILRDPFANFGISAKTDEGTIHKFITSLDSSKKNYISRVLGGKVFDREADEVPIFVEEVYPNLLKYLYRRQHVRGLNCCTCYRPAARFNNTLRNSLGWWMTEWQTPRTPHVVSELRGTDVSRLFRFVSISDGTAANREYKISITNISFERVEFDVVIRDFYDTDANPNRVRKIYKMYVRPISTKLYS